MYHPGNFYRVGQKQYYFGYSHSGIIPVIGCGSKTNPAPTTTALLSQPYVLLEQYIKCVELPEAAAINIQRQPDQVLQEEPRKRTTETMDIT
jgi:hypothetical protein